MKSEFIPNTLRRLGIGRETSLDWFRQSFSVDRRIERLPEVA
jgi:hypothetical protein